MRMHMWIYMRVHMHIYIYIKYNGLAEYLHAVIIV